MPATIPSARARAAFPGIRALRCPLRKRASTPRSSFHQARRAYYCFHDIDLAPDAADAREYESNLQKMVVLARERQQATGVKLLWGTANLFSHPRYMNGAATNPDFKVVARAAVQVKVRWRPP